MPLWHNRVPNPEMNNPPGRKERDARQVKRQDRFQQRTADPKKNPPPPKKREKGS